MLLPALRTRLLLIMFMAATASVTACGGGATDIEDEPTVATMRLSIGTTTLNVNAATGVVTGGPVNIARNASVNVSAQFLRSDGTADPVVNATAFQLSATSANTGTVTFTRSGSFSGTLTGIAPGTTNITFGLFHVGEGHNEFSWPVTVTVTQ